MQPPRWISGNALAFNLDRGRIIIEGWNWRIILIRTKDVSIESTKMFQMSTVISIIARQHPTEVVTSHISQKDFEYLQQVDDRNSYVWYIFWGFGWWETEHAVENNNKPWIFCPCRGLRFRSPMDFLIGSLHHVSQDDGLDLNILRNITMKITWNIINFLLCLFMMQ